MSRLYDLIAPFLGAGIAIALLCVIVFMIIGRFYRKYWMVLGYAIWELLATIGFTIADVLARGTSQTTTSAMTPAQAWYARLYWTNDVIVDLLRFILVVVLIYMASQGVKRVSGRILSIIVLAAMVLPFFVFDFKTGPVEVPYFNFSLKFPRTAWFRSTSELLNFGAAILNLMLWGTLLASRKRDPQVLLVSLGLGVVVAGTAMAYGIRIMLDKQDFRFVGYLIMNITQLVGWLLWCRAFRPAAKKPPRVEALASQ
jgi:hypothetical protein